MNPKYDKIFSWFGLGTGSDKRNRCMLFITPQLGWRGFVDKYIKPQIALGIRRFWLHTPMGSSGEVRNYPPINETNIRFDQWSEARVNRSLRWLSTGFPEAIRPLTDQGIQVVAYLGPLQGAPEFEGVAFTQKHLFMDRVRTALLPFLAANCDIAIDTACRSHEGQYVYELGRLLKSLKTRVYIEAAPYRGTEEFCDWDICCSNLQWKNVENPAHWQPQGNFPGFIPPSELKGEIVRGWWEALPAQYPDYVAWYKDTVPPVLKQGQTAAISLYHYVKEGGKLDDLLPAKA